jgi:predicted 3-demethylubiquinone-9 3-methyltransferase (glyoxalase superfamily)
MSKVTVNQQIVPFLWFDGKAEEAMNFYTSVFPNSAIQLLKHWGEGSSFPTNWIMAGTMNLNGLKIHLFDGGPQFKFSEGISFFVNCETQEEIDTYWAKLTADGGEEGPCGWLKDKFGLSWQIIPAMMIEKFTNGDPARVTQMMQALFNMKKLNIAALEEAYNK